MDSALTGGGIVLTGWFSLLLGLTLTVGGTLASTRLLRPRSRIDAAVTSGIAASAGVTFVMLSAGIPGLLWTRTVLALLCAWAIAAGLATLRWPPHEARVAWTAGLANWRRHPWATALVLLAALALSWQLVVALVLPPYAYDALTYHLTTVAYWVQSGSLAPSPFSRCCAYYPFSPDLLVAFPALLMHDNALVGLVQFPFVLLGGAATAGLARIVGLPRATAVAAGALFVMTPVVLTQAPTNYVDVTLAALVLASLYAITRFAQTGAGQHLIVAGLAAGMALGTKGIGPLWAAALFTGAILACAIAIRSRRARASSAIGWLLGAAVTGAPLGAWWYVRNFVTTGNPLYPFTIKLLGKTVFHGPFDVGNTLTVPPVGAADPWPLNVALNWASDLKLWNLGSYDYQQRLGGLGPLWAWLGAPLLVVLIVVLIRRRQIALLPIAAILLVFALQPYAWWARFTLPLAAIGSVAVAWAATEAPWRGVRMGLQALTFVLVGIGVVLSSYAVDPQGRARELPATRVLTLIGSPRDERTLGRLFHHEYAFLDQVPDDASVVVDLDSEQVRFVSPLFGPHFSRQVRPGDDGRALIGAWIVTSVGRPLDRAAQADHALVWDVRGVRVWQPKPPSR